MYFRGAPRREVDYYIDYLAFIPVFFDHCGKRVIELKSVVREERSAKREERNVKNIVQKT